jgi:hypothetical protein
MLFKQLEQIINYYPAVEAALWKTPPSTHRMIRMARVELSRGSTNPTSVQFAVYVGDNLDIHSQFACQRFSEAILDLQDNIPQWRLGKVRIGLYVRQ